MKAGKISYAGVGVTVGGVIGFLGVLVGWFSYSYPLNGGTATVTLSGTADWTGTVALVAGIAAFAFGGAYVLIQDAKLRRTIGVLMAHLPPRSCSSCPSWASAGSPKRSACRRRTSRPRRTRGS